MKKRIVSSLLLITTFLLLLPVRGSASEDSSTPLYVSPVARIELAGDRATSQITEGEFSCYIISESQGIPLNTNERIVHAGGLLELGSFTFQKEGVYPFLIRQRDLQAPGMTYDENQYRLLFEVKKDKSGKLICNTHFLKGSEYITELVFYNSYQEEPEGQLQLEATQREVSQLEVGVEGVISQQIHLANTGGQDLVGIVIRGYVPKNAQYLSHTDEQGDYGVINGEEHVTYYLPRLVPGEERELSLTYRLHTCRATGSQIAQTWFYEVTEVEEKPFVNRRQNPGEAISLQPLSGL
ncbi:pilin isopeptide linkage protein [Lachnospiraceae bacterium PM6-15]|uniref:Spy0128 family protein n=1 Tax=Ohessyouella blattaphilus TaxID=2949333 RepID=UPI003E2C64A5